jgi:hypothetical protein
VSDAKRKLKALVKNRDTRECGTQKGN